MRVKKNGESCLICGEEATKGLCFKCRTEVVKSGVALVKQNYILPDFGGRECVVVSRDDFNKMNGGIELEGDAYLIRPKVMRAILKVNNLKNSDVQKIRR